MIAMSRKAAFARAALVASLGLVISATLVMGQERAPGEEPPTPTAESAPASVDVSLQKETLSLFGRLDVGTLLAENSLTQWLILLGAILLGLVAGRIAGAMLEWLARRFAARHRPVQGEMVEGAAGPAGLALLALGLGVGLAMLRGVSPPLGDFLARTLLLIYSIAVFWYLFNLVGVLDILLHRAISKPGSTLDRQVVPLVRKCLRVSLVVVGILFVVDSVFHQDIGAWLAGLGIAGLAVSLAAQDSLKNLFGSITILFDRPFRVGDRIVCSGYDGTVAEIGFRSTKIRTAEGHVVTIPNANIVSNTVENIGRRPYIRRVINVTIAYDTPREKVRQGVQILRDILEEDGIREPIHPTIDGQEMPPRAYFNDYKADSLNLFVTYWYAPPDWWDYMDHAQRLNFRIFEEFEKAGIEFAFPTQTLLLAGDRKRELAVRMLGKDA
jgi:MscS family membrane protein